MDRVRNFLALLRGQLWPLPLLFALAAVGLAFVLLKYGQLDANGRIWWLYSGDAATARDLLGSLLSGLMTMTSLVVSVTFVILTLAANQLGPHLISIFMGDRQIQSVLGLFIGTILYVILVLRTLDDTLGPEGVPHLAVTAASVLTILCLLALLFYIHKIARSIIADNVVEAVSQELRGTLREILPDRDSNEVVASERFHGVSWPLGIEKIGYVQVVQYKHLVSLACEADLRIAVNVRAGHYLLREGKHIDVYSEAAPDEKLRERIRSAFTVGTERTPAQDPEHGIMQLVEIATRALSSGINDPFTAVAVIDRLAAAFEEVFARDVQPCMLCDSRGERRVLADRSDVPGLLAAAFHPIRQAGKDNPAILIHMAEIITELACVTRKPVQRQALSDQLARIAETSALQQFAHQDREDIGASIARAGRSLISASAATGDQRAERH
jgi:uncharacterized membrane protein